MSSSSNNSNSLQLNRQNPSGSDGSSDRTNLSCAESFSGRAMKKPSSAYVPHNRLSRYLSALSSLALVRFNRTIGSELPLDRIGLFSNASFGWLNEYLKAGYASGMRDKALPSLSQRETCNVNGPRLEALLHAHFVEKGQAGASIPRVAWHFVRTRVFIGSVIYLAGTLVSLAGPILVLREIIRATEDRNDLNVALSFVNKSIASNATINGEAMRAKERQLIVDEMIVFAHTGLLILIEVVSQFLVAWSSALNLRTACRLRSACLAVAYKKLLSSSLRCSTGAQQTLTYFVPDSEILHELIGLGPVALSGPTVLVIIAAFAWLTLGTWALSGILVILLFYSTLVIVAYCTKAFAARAIEYSLRRMSLVEELISNIQLAKIALWDRHFQDKIKNIRSRELDEMQFGGFSEGCGLSMVHMIPVATVATITLFTLHFGQQISFVRYVPVLVLFLVNLKQCVRTSWMALSSISRGLAFLNKLKSILILQEADRFLDKPIDRNFAIIINNGHFSWSSKNRPKSANAAKRSSRFYVDGGSTNKASHSVELQSFPGPVLGGLSEIDFYVAKGKVVGIYGPQDSGKTSFLLSILGQLQCVGGTVALDGTCSYVPAEPWLMDDTVRENVLFGEPYDSSRYYRVMRSTQLHSEIAGLPALDDTDLGAAEFGPAQRQKIGLARVLYAQRDINLLDEPLASVGHRECLEILDAVLQRQLAGKTVVLASDRIELLSRCSVVYVMHEGRIVESGSHRELLQSSPGYAKSARLQSRMASLRLRSEELTARLTPSSPRTDNGSSFGLEGTAHLEDQLLVGRSLEFPVLHSFSEAKPKTGLGVYLEYTGGFAVCALLALLVALYAFSIAVAPVCIVHVGKMNEDDVKSASGVLAMQVGFMIVCGVILTFAYNKTVTAAATKLHDYWVESLVRAQISIFSTATISLLLNICSLNLQEVDLVLPRAIITVLMNCGISCFSLAILWYLSPWLLLPALAFVVISVMFSVYVRGAVLSLHELKVTSATLVLNHIGNTVQGRATIQAFSKEKDFTKKYYKLFNENSTYDFMLYATRLWLEFRLKLLSILVLSAVILMSEVLYTDSNGLSRFGLAYFCTLQLTLSSVHAASAINSVYTSLMALNSVDHYMKNIPKEREGTARLSSMWPTDGSLEFRNVLFYDREDSCRKPLSFSLASAEKLAVVSVQADVKMAFVSALFRFMELPAGEIFIGGTSISQVPLDMLRRCICFVPGDPSLFNGTIRHNLDPSEKMADQAIMRVLQRVYLWEKVSRLPEKLVSDSRHLFTVYERILIFLARALLNESTKIVIVEEPQADVADDRGEILDVVLRDAFAEHTVIRLSSHRIRSCPKSLVLDDEEDFYSERGSSTLSQQTTTTELYTALPANILSESFVSL
ncbi:multidrug resistance-associated protein 5-like [Copidosoma floridanum]|uniref:multidrug resistance-associated protein 5-like n=1 Tax=Copidosoma floridanum TaxID=29053 RepID=UPI0006C9D4B0|nr:multidrug resistance-associated protein 5-like [Copidosoma floridanum]XP_014203939.1 multidrug resistance-associated protein 5-like [Copidosoma floridanum]XP_014203940.1 multidrug resistance-associated protein 5-like [Copidosoma floridanum]XP_014203941.1 multidrug resistance-associated protein 5-like [Copidosoma floridanum]XP_014203942.1 multidrug resistance-associated protein 5-like [Copidosoma floridanum]XP_014203944.1 multidrug resistance-associated protein 5-like [Copidosoma floridanum]